jgi:hypothetical protein
MGAAVPPSYGVYYTGDQGARLGISLTGDPSLPGAVAGATVPLINPDTGEVWDVPVGVVEESESRGWKRAP